MKMVTALMDCPGILPARFIGYDHGGAVAQLLMSHGPGRIDMAMRQQLYRGRRPCRDAAGKDQINASGQWIPRASARLAR